MLACGARAGVSSIKSTDVEDGGLSDEWRRLVRQWEARQKRRHQWPRRPVLPRRAMPILTAVP